MLTSLFELPHLFELTYQFVIASAVGTALLLSFAIRGFVKTRQNYFGWILPVLALSIVTNTLLELLYKGGYSGNHFSEPFQLLIGPVFWFYLQYLMKGKISKKQVFLHLLTFTLTFALFIGFLVNVWFGQQVQKHVNFVLWILSIVVYAHLWAYYFLCRKALKQYRLQLMQSCSSIERLSESWIGNALLAALISYTGLSVIYLLNHGPASIAVNQALAVIYSLLTYYISFIMLHHLFAYVQESGEPNTVIKNADASADFEAKYQEPSVIREASVSKGPSFSKEPPFSLEQSGSRYEKSGLDPKTAEDISARLFRIMEDECPYLDPELKIATLAAHMNVAVHHLSQVINSGNGDGEGQNFYDFINSYRIKAVIKMFQDPTYNSLTILNIALDSGFTSKATFNRVFKKHTNQTPFGYRKTIIQK